MRPCLQPGCHRLTERTRCPIHERQFQAWRNRKRGDLYDGAWQRHSRERRAEVGRCMEADATCKGLLSVDHPTDDVLCLSHHDRREALRRRQG